MELALSSRRKRENVVVTVRLADGVAPSDAAISLKPTAGGSPLAGEYDAGDGRLHFVLDAIEAGAERTFELEAGAARTSDVLAFRDGAQCVELLRCGEPLLTYCFDPAYPKPFINPLMGPSGVSILRDALPPNTAGEHPWQRGITLMHGELNDVECWNEPPGKEFGTTTQDDIARCVTPVSASLKTRNSWHCPDGSPLMSDDRTLRVFATPDWPVVMDLSLTLKATAGDVVIGQTKEAGFLSVRIAPTMNGGDGGRMENSYGAVGESECWSRAAHWMDYSGPVAGKTVGIAILDDPENLRYPTHWHTRDYGLFAANCWNWDGPYTLPAGELLTFRWRLVVHAGDAAAAGIADLFLDYETAFSAKLEDE